MDQDAMLSIVPTTHAEHELWRAAAPPSGAEAQVMRFYLGAARAGGAHRLVSRRAPAAHYVASAASPERASIERLLAGLRYRLEFVSDSLVRATQLAGFLAGELAFASNHKEFDFGVTLFELTPPGEYLEFSSYWARACQGIDHAQRALLAGRRRHLSFQSGRRLNRLLAAGSRIVVVLGTRHHSHSLDSVEDPSEPLRVRWHSDSFIEVPLGERRFTR